MGIYFKINVIFYAQCAGHNILVTWIGQRILCQCAGSNLLIDPAMVARQLLYLAISKSVDSRITQMTHVKLPS